MTWNRNLGRSRVRTLVIVSIVVSALGPLRAATAAETNTPSTKYRGDLASVLAQAAPDQLVPVSVVLTRQITDPEIARLSAGRTKPEIRRAIGDHLRAMAMTDQAEMLKELRTRVAVKQAARLRPLWIGNVVGVDATRAVIEWIAARPEVDHINWNPKRDVFLGPKVCSEDPDLLASRTVPGRLATASGGGMAGAFSSGGGGCPANRSAAGGPVFGAADLASFSSAAGAGEPGASRGTPLVGASGSPASVECGVQLCRAPDVWSGFGDHGENAVVAMIDTGICWNHPDIHNRIWVNPGEDLNHDGVVYDSADMNGVDDDGNGFIDDVIGWDFDIGDNNPNDDSNGHGSHTAGTVAGDGTSGTQTGMAPGAKVMAVRVGVQFTDEVDVWNAMQYAAANNADLISMSLGWPHNQNPDRATWRQNCDNTIAMGTTMIVAAGNEGGGNEPDNVRTPGDVPKVITVGAVDCSDVQASFTSLGPVTWQNVPPYNDYPYPPGLTKPDVAGPGVNTTSLSFCSGYTQMSGTSMATPHVAGAAALMVSADPTLTRDEIDAALEEHAVDLGTPGKDNTFGAGRIDAYESVNAVAGKVHYQSHLINDSNSEYGNNDGGIDIGETITMPVTVINNKSTAATQIFGILTTPTAGVTIMNNTAYWPDIAGNATAQSLAPHFTFKVNTACNTAITFRLEIRYDGNQVAHSSWTVRVGTGQNVAVFSDDFETDKGWTSGGNAAVSGRWVRDDPHGTQQNGNQVQPEDDHSAAPGTKCWVTGNPNSTNPFDGDVDSGTATLTSPTIDGTDLIQMNLDYWRWFWNSSSNQFNSSNWVFSVSNNNGSTWTAFETLTTTATPWTEHVVDLAAVTQPSSQMKLKIDVTEQCSFGTVCSALLEGLLDDVTINGLKIVCDNFSPPAHSAPNCVPATLLETKANGTVHLTWTAPPTDGSHGPATSYVVSRATAPNGTFTDVGNPTATQWDDVDAANGGPSYYYRVRARNSGGDSPVCPQP